MSDLAQTVDRAPTTRRRNALLGGLAGVVVLAGLGATAYWKLYASHFVSTDNAYAAVEIAQVTPSVAGTIAEVRVRDTQAVKRGDILAVIDPTDAKLTLAQADASEKRAVAQLTSAEADLERARIDLTRRQALVASGSVSGDELTRAKNAHASAQATLSAMKAAIAEIRARREQAEIDLNRTVIRAPVNGVVARRQVQLGQRVSAGTPLLSLIPVQEMHVDANFKEGQLEDVRVGQAVTLKADIYGDSVTYHGTVEGFSGGSGASLAAIPAQNATGNWIKVVQRLPVRIRLDSEDLSHYPLRVGLSMVATIDTRTGLE